MQKWLEESKYLKEAMYKYRKNNGDESALRFAEGIIDGLCYIAYEERKNDSDTSRD